MSLRSDIRARAVAVLAEQIANTRVITGQQWPMEKLQLPALLLDMRSEDKRAISADGATGQPAYSVSATMVVRAREVVSSEPGAAPFGLDHGRAIEAVLDRWIEAIQSALLQDPAFVRMFKAIPAVRVETQVSALEEQMVAEAGVTLTLVWEEDWSPRVVDNFASLRLGVDAIDPQDPLGTYPNTSGFPDPAPPPRDRGPDGRAEIGADLIIPTT